MRESRSLAASKRTMVMQERLFFRNIPLSTWIEHEMVVEEGNDLDQLPKESVFGTSTIATSTNAAPSLATSSAAGERRLPVVHQNVLPPLVGRTVGSMRRGA